MTATLPTSSRTVHCVLTGDARAALPMAVVLGSAARSVSPSWRLHFHVIDCGLHDWQVERLRRCGGRAGVRVDVHRVTSDRLRPFPTCRHFSPAANARLLLASLLPDSDRVIYLDSDLVVDRDLSGLWQTDLDQTGLAACGNNAPELPMAAPTAMPYAADALADPDDTYFNSGLMVIDLRRWRALDVERAWGDFFGRFGGQTICPDQDALNFVFSGRYRHLNPEWNWHCPSVGGHRLRPPGGDRVYHLVGQYKPWNGGPRHTSLWPYASRVRAAGWLRGWEWPAYLAGAACPPRLRRVRASGAGAS